MIHENSSPSEMIEPIGQEQRQQVLARTQFFIACAEKLFNKSFPVVPVEFDLPGRTAGMYKVVGRRRSIRYNPWIFAKYFNENLSGTVPHEVAHFVVDQIYGLHRVKSHGVEWRALMAEFDADPGVTFDLDLTGIPQRRQARHPYQCPCQPHTVSSTRHNRMVRGTSRYYCLSCRGELTFAGLAGL